MATQAKQVLKKMSAQQLQHIKLAQTLPPKLQRFFAKYPPKQFLTPAAATSQASTPASPDSTSTAPTPSSSDASAPPAATEEEPYRNPFQPYKHPVTRRWHDPVYSLRRQADLVKIARAHGVEELLPFTVKSTEERLRKKEEFGLRVKGTGVGQKVKGKGWERDLKGKLEKRRQAMLDMPKMIQEWKQRGHGRGWKKWPK